MFYRLQTACIILAIFYRAINQTNFSIIKNKKMKKNSLLLLPLLAILALSCKKEQTPAPLKIGDFHQGGYVFYLDSTSEHGMVMAPPETEQSLQWGCYGILMDFGNPNITAEFGWGEYCTSRMVIKCNEPYAAGRYCYNLESGGFKDWFMPNLREWAAGNPKEVGKLRAISFVRNGRPIQLGHVLM